MNDGPIGEIFVTCSLVPDLERAVADASEALGFGFTPIQQAPLTLRTAAGLEQFDLRFVYSTGQAPYLEFVEEVPGSYFSSGGVTAYRHVGIWVDDLAATSDLVASRGYPLEAAGVEGDIEPFGFVHHRSADGVRLELVDRARQPVLEAWLGGGSLDI
jgi:hypothetical protein